MPHDVTELLLEWNAGNKAALDRLMPIVSEELHKLAAIYMRDEGSSKTLQPTALVNEVYLKLVDRRRVDWQNRSHFFGFAATTMRRILVDRARARRADKRGGDLARVTLEDAAKLTTGPDIDLLDLDRALGHLETLDPRLVQVVELRFFAGLSIQEAAEVLDIGVATVNRDWRTAKAFLLSRLEGDDSANS